MGTTTNFGFDYPDSTGHTRLWEHFQTLAADIDTLLGYLVGLPAPVSAASNGTATSGTTETRDTVLGNYTFTVPTVGASWRYQAMALAVGVNASVTNDVYRINIRDGGASTPTSSSTLVASIQTSAISVAAQSHCVLGTWVPGAGTHTLGVFLVRIAGTGIGTPVAQGANRELLARFVGTV